LEESVLLVGFLDGILEEIIWSSIWPWIVSGDVVDRLRRMTMVMAVCRGWRDWVSITDFYLDDVVSFYETARFDNVLGEGGREN
jgi:hypothetical protein